jgi:hypothetical protein
LRAVPAVAAHRSDRARITFVVEAQAIDDKPGLAAFGGRLGQLGPEFGVGRLKSLDLGAQIANHAPQRADRLAHQLIHNQMHQPDRRDLVHGWGEVLLVLGIGVERRRIDRLDWLGRGIVSLEDHGRIVAGGASPGVILIGERGGLRRRCLDMLP